MQQWLFKNVGEGIKKERYGGKFGKINTTVIILFNKVQKENTIWKTQKLMSINGKTSYSKSWSRNQLMNL